MEAGGVISNLYADFPSLSEPSGILAANNAQNLAKLQSIVDKHLN
jgi:hypothetical protein